MRRIRSKLTYANVISTIALFLVLAGGSAVALNGQNTVQSDDLGPGAQVKAADVAANAVNGSNVVDNSIAGTDLAPSALPKGRATSFSCNPTSAAFVDCGTLTINLTRSSRVLVVASSMWYGAAAGNRGVCRIAVDGTPFSADANPGELTDNTDPVHEQNLTLTDVAGPLPPGSHTFRLSCNEEQGDMIHRQTYISAVVLSSS